MKALPDIRQLVPHAGPMVLLDRVLRADDESLCAEVRIGPDSLFCADGAVGAWVGIEYMAQAIAAWAGYGARKRGEPVGIGFLLGARRYEADVPAFACGSVLHVHVHCAMQGENGLGAFECWIEAAGVGAAGVGVADAGAAGGVTLARATVTVFQPKNVNDFLDGSSDGGVV
jgi:3-oxoacyl-[acyl-carrier-protein] synthase I